MTGGLTRSVGLGAIVVLSAGLTFAEMSPRPAGYDQHVQMVAFNPLNVVRVVCTPTNSTQIIFAQTEEITQVAIGDAEAWLAQPAGNLLFIKPTAIKMPTNMQVVTKRPDGATRSYQFSLIAASRSQPGASPAIFAVSFTYPRDDDKAHAALVAQQAAIATEKTAMTRLATAWAKGPRNWRYVAQGSTLIEPLEVSDNAHQTAFRFPGAMRIPTIYVGAPDGSETIVPYTMVGDQAVVQTTARMFTLRDGREVLRVINRAFDPVGHNPGTGTGTSDVSRVLRSSAK